MGVSMPMMQVGIMRMLVTRRGVMVQVRMRLGYWPVMRVLMVFVMNVAVFMVHRSVVMGMNVTFGQVHRQPESHERSGN